MISDLFGIELPIVQAPMAGSQGSALAIAVSNAGALGSQPCAMLSPDSIRMELQAIAASMSKPFNVNFFVHKHQTRDSAREASWRQLLAPYFAEYGIESAGRHLRTGPTARASGEHPGNCGRRRC